MSKKEIYVEIEIDGSIEDVWEKSQNPALHEQWDIRFSSITYLPKKKNDVQKFTYTRKILPFVEISGWGESVGEHTKGDGTKSSSLHFGTPQKISPIKEGRGYWQYIPNEKTNGTTFLTSYRYEPNYGMLGKVFDAILFRPLMGWGTALSFDVLKRWLENKETPHSQYVRFFITYSLMVFFAFVWMYHGLVPKIITMHPEELRMTGHLFSMSNGTLKGMLIVIGVVELLFGIIWLLYRNKRHLFILQCFLFPLLMVSALLVDGTNAFHPFSPVTFNLALLLLSFIGVAVSKDVPTATTCLRKRRG